MFSFYNMQDEIKQNNKNAFALQSCPYFGKVIKGVSLWYLDFLWCVYLQVAIFVILRTKSSFRRVTLSETTNVCADDAFKIFIFMFLSYISHSILQEVSLNGWVLLVLVNCLLCANIFTLLIHCLGSKPGRMKMFHKILKPTLAEINSVFEFLCIKMSGCFRRNQL